MFLIHDIEKVSSESQTEEVTKSPGRDEIMAGKKKETELAELENLFDNMDINRNEKRNTNTGSLVTRLGPTNNYASSMNGCYETYNWKPFF